jgi:hypothetical protein
MEEIGRKESLSIQHQLLAVCVLFPPLFVHFSWSTLLQSLVLVAYHPFLPFPLVFLFVPSWTTTTMLLNYTRLYQKTIHRLQYSLLSHLSASTQAPVFFGCAASSDGSKCCSTITTGGQKQLCQSACPLNKKLNPITTTHIK